MEIFPELMMRFMRGEKLDPQQFESIRQKLIEIDGNSLLVSKWEKMPFTGEDYFNQQLKFRTVGAKLLKSVAQNIGSNASTLVTWDSIQYNNLGVGTVDLTSSRITVNLSGRYVIGVNVSLSAGGPTVLINVNGSNLAAGNTISLLNFSEDTVLQTGDYVEMYVLNASGKAVSSSNIYVRWLGIE